jgi:hypothetical protein
MGANSAPHRKPDPSLLTRPWPRIAKLAGPLGDTTTPNLGPFAHDDPPADVLAGRGPALAVSPPNPDRTAVAICPVGQQRSGNRVGGPVQGERREQQLAIAEIDDSASATQLAPLARRRWPSPRRRGLGQTKHARCWACGHRLPTAFWTLADFKPPPQPMGGRDLCRLRRRPHPRHLRPRSSVLPEARSSGDSGATTTPTTPAATPPKRLIAAGGRHMAKRASGPRVTGRRRLLPGPRTWDDFTPLAGRNKN